MGVGNGLDRICHIMIVTTLPNAEESSCRNCLKLKRWCRDLHASLLIGRSFVRIAVKAKKSCLRRKWSRAWETELLKRDVQAIQRRGKWILIALTDPIPGPAPLDGPGEGWLLVHLGMTGQFTVVEDAPRETHTHLIFTLNDGNELRFRDVRRFGSVSYYPNRAALDAFFIDNNLGPEPFDLDPDYWRAALTATKRNLKSDLARSIRRGGGRQYLRRRIALYRPIAPRHPRSGDHAQRSRAAAASGHRRVDTRHRAARLQHSRLRRRLGLERGNAARIPRLWPNRRTLLAVPNADRADDAGGAIDAFLPAMSAGNGCRQGKSFSVTIVLPRPAGAACMLASPAGSRLNGGSDVVSCLQTIAGRNQPRTQVPISVRHRRCRAHYLELLVLRLSDRTSGVYAQAVTTCRLLVSPRSRPAAP